MKSAYDIDFGVASEGPFPATGVVVVVVVVVGVFLEFEEENFDLAFSLISETEEEKVDVLIIDALSLSTSLAAGLVAFGLIGEAGEKSVGYFSPGKVF